MQNHVREDTKAFLIPAFVVLVAALAVFVWDMARHNDGVWEPSALHTLGMLFVVIAVINNVGCAIIMGRSYSSTLVTREDHQLITRGMYRYVRHPIYSGVILATTGMAMVSSSLLGLLVVWGLIPLFLRRIRLEESMLVDEFGKEYEIYRERTKKLVPFLY